MSGRIEKLYELTSPGEARAFYDTWAADYEAELQAHGYTTPVRCAEALADHAALPWEPVLEVGCGTGLGGVALRAAGFEVIDGFDISEAMLAEARAKGVYRQLAPLDLSQPLDAIEPGTYQNAAAIGVLNPAFMPPTVIDELLAKLPVNGCLVCSLNDRSAADGTMKTRILELTEYGTADLIFKDHGRHMPGLDLQSTVYVLKKR